MLGLTWPAVISVSHHDAHNLRRFTAKHQVQIYSGVCDSTPPVVQGSRPKERRGQRHHTCELAFGNVESLGIVRSLTLLEARATYMVQDTRARLIGLICSYTVYQDQQPNSSVNINPLWVNFYETLQALAGYLGAVGSPEVLLGGFVRLSWT